MSQEVARLVRLDLDDDRRALVEATIEAEAIPRTTSARGAAERYDELCGRLEDAARAALAAGAESVRITARADCAPTFADPSRPERLPDDGGVAEAWLRAGALAVELRDPFGRGPTLRMRAVPGAATAEVTARWRALSEHGDLLGSRQARALRFRERVDDIVRGGTEALVPTGVPGRTLTEGLRDIASGRPRPAGVPVVYRDGSRGPAFPVGGLGDGAGPGAPSGRILRLALLSLRHLDLDARLDGALLPGSLVSQPRSEGETDDLVHAESAARLAAMCDRGPLTLHVHQTGVACVITGFYRAVVEVLRGRPGRLTVVPCCHRAPATSGSGPGRLTEGTPWRA